MLYLNPFLFLILGFFFLFLGGDLLVRSSVSLARRWKVSPLFIGFTLVSIGTSAPEFFACLFAALRSAPDLALGNVVGSNVFNLLVISGLAACFSPLFVPLDFLKFEGPLLCLSGIIFLFSFWDSQMNRLEGAFLLLSFILILFLSFRRAKRMTASLLSKDRKINPLQKGHEREKKWNLLLSFFWLIVGILFLSFGARLVVQGGETLGHQIGLSKAVIGILILSSGTGLPELITSAVAAYRGENELSFSNILGSNLVNTLGIPSVISLISPLIIKEKSLIQESLIMIGVTLGFVLLVWMQGGKIRRGLGIFLLGGYILYIYRLF